MDTYELKQKLKKTAIGKEIYIRFHQYHRKKEDVEISRYHASGEADRFHIFQGCATGKRCFIIGNGPSLTIEDLETLKYEDTFASNRIYGVFNKTEWRPTYYCVQDEVLLEQIKNNIADKVQDFRYIFLPFNVREIFPTELRDDKRVWYFFSSWRQAKAGEICFSENCHDYIGCGMTVTYAMIQIAVWMGYKEIYLLGVDHNYTVDKLNKATEASYPSFIAKVDLKKQNAPHVEDSTKAYIVAREFCKEKKVEIINATRGGKLEVYPRKSLEDII